MSAESYHTAAENGNTTAAPARDFGLYLRIDENARRTKGVYVKGVKGKKGSGVARIREGHLRLHAVVYRVSQGSKTGSCDSTLEYLADEAGLSLRTCEGYMRDACSRGLILKHEDAWHKIHYVAIDTEFPSRVWKVVGDLRERDRKEQARREEKNAKRRAPVPKNFADSTQGLLDYREPNLGRPRKNSPEPTNVCVESELDGRDSITLPITQEKTTTMSCAPAQVASTHLSSSSSAVDSDKEEPQEHERQQVHEQAAAEEDGIALDGEEGEDQERDEGQEFSRECLASIEQACGDLGMAPRAVTSIAYEMRAAGDDDARIAQVISAAREATLKRNADNPRAFFSATARTMADERRKDDASKRLEENERERRKERALRGLVGDVDVEAARERFLALDETLRNKIDEIGMQNAKDAWGYRWASFSLEKRKEQRKIYVLKAFVDFERLHSPKIPTREHLFDGSSNMAVGG